MRPAEIRRSLLETNRAFPFPADELNRTGRRRWILDFVPKGGVGAEIGVFRGHFSQILLAVAKPKKLYLVDPWRLQGEFFRHVGRYTNAGKLPTQLAWEETILRAKQFPDTETIVMEAYFPNCLSEITEPLDWIYLDSSHDHDGVLAQLRAVDRILPPDGIILGDDWHGHPTGQHQGVITAVNEFVRENPYDFVAAGPFLQWCIRRTRTA
jgi:hypothetical protein